MPRNPIGEYIADAKAWRDVVSFLDNENGRRHSVRTGGYNYFFERLKEAPEVVVVTRTALSMGKFTPTARADDA